MSPRKSLTRTGPFHRATFSGTILLAAALVLAGSACDKDSPSKPPVTDPGGTFPEVAPDFHLVDVNPASPTAGQNVSPRDELGKVSGWYFGEAT
jgi:hypothetical protein